MNKAFISVMLIFVACQAQREQYVVGTDPTMPPNTFREEGSNDVTGLDIDFLNAVAEVANFDYTLEQLDWDTMFQKVKDNELDFATSALTIDDERKETYDFSVPFCVQTHMILAKEGTDIKSAQDLVGKIVAAKEGTSSEIEAEKILGEGSPNILRAVIMEDGIQAVLNGTADAHLGDYAALQYYVNKHPDEGLVLIEDEQAFTKHFCALMFPKGSELVAPINEAITTILENGKYAEIYKKWMETESKYVDLLLDAGLEEDPYDVFEEWCMEEGCEEEWEIEEPDLQWDI